jgi:glycosyltransferase involved in cell wall biosynthesis
LLWAGKMEARKALPLILEALAQLKDLPVELIVAGDGPMRGEWERLATSLNVRDRVQFRGRVPWTEMSQLYQTADAFVFTSLRDAFGTQVLEAMAHGLPVLTLNHQGVAAFVPDAAGIKVAVTNPRDTIAGLAQGIRRLARLPEERQGMGRAALEFAKTQTWERRTERMLQIYHEARAEFLRRTSPRQELRESEAT